jgi:hypothetical protein
MHTMTARWDERRGMYSVRSPYEARHTIKEINWTEREWDPAQRAWWIAETAIDELVMLVESAGHKIVVARRGGSPKPDRDPAAWVGEAFESCPPDNRARLRRALASCFHPDIGGATDAASAINQHADRYTG